MSGTADEAGGVDVVLDGPGDGGADAAERAFERGSDARADQRGDHRREGRRVDRLLRDRAILTQQHAEALTELEATRAALAAAQANRAKAVADGLGSELNAAERAVADAVSAGDPEAQARANRRVAEIAASRTAASLAAQRDQGEAEAAARRAKEVRDRPAAPRLSETTEEWLAANRWYGEDQRMTRQAQVLDAEAREDGLVADSPEYWRYVERGLQARFGGRVAALYGEEAAGGHAGGNGAARAAPARGNGAGNGAGERAGNGADHDDQGEADPALAARVPARGASGAAPVARGNGAGGAGASPARSVRLTAEAVEQARLLGMTPQAYAKRAADLVARGLINGKTIYADG